MLTITDYILGSVGFEIPTSALTVILHNRGVAEGTDVSTLSTQTKELCVADALKWGVTMVSGNKRIEDKDADWAHAETIGFVTTVDKTQWKKMANEIYVKYGEAQISIGFKIHSL